jgi:ribosome-binding protein aMBF1 (putative translation factor)
LPSFGKKIQNNSREPTKKVEQKVPVIVKESTDRLKINQSPKRTAAMPGKLIRRRREQLGLSQQEMAERLNMSQSTYSRIEQKDEDITIRQLKTIAEVLEIQLADLLPDELIIYNHDQRSVIHN